MVPFIREHLMENQDQVKVYQNIKIQINILVIGKMIKFMVKVCIFFPMEKDMKVIQQQEKNKVMENIYM